MDNYGVKYTNIHWVHSLFAIDTNFDHLPNFLSAHSVKLFFEKFPTLTVGR